MDITILISKIMGPIFIVVAVGVLLNLKNYRLVTEDFLSEPAFVYLGGLIALSCGIIIVLVHNLWVLNGRVIITILGWMSVVKGVSLLVFPEIASKLARAYVKNSGLLIAHLIVALAIGAVLTIIGYYI